MVKAKSCKVCGMSPLPKFRRTLCSDPCKREQNRRNSEKYNRARAKSKPKIIQVFKKPRKVKLKECPVCRGQFKPKRERQIFCSRQCYIDDMRGKSKTEIPKSRNCSICGKPFLVEGNFLKCLDCRGKFRVKCLHCGLSFISNSSSPYQTCEKCKNLIKEARRAKAKKVKQKSQKKPKQGKNDFSTGEVWILDESTWKWKAEQRGESHG